jgi:hypothetical protein
VKGAVVLLAVMIILTGCQGSEDTGARAARMEMQDDAACKGRPDYQQCRKNLFAYRQQALIEDQQQQARVQAAADGLAAAGRAMQSIDNPPVNVNVTCTFGCR